MVVQRFSGSGRGAGGAPRRAAGCAVVASRVVLEGGGDPRGAQGALRLRLSGWPWGEVEERRWYWRPNSSAGR